MKLEKLIIYNYKKFTPFLDVNFPTSKSLLVGVNGSGKSSVLEALTLIFNDLYLYYKAPKKKPSHDFFYEITYKIKPRKRHEFDEEEIFFIKNNPSNRFNFEFKINGVNKTKAQIEREYITILDFLPQIYIYYSGLSNKLENVGVIHNNRFSNYLKRLHKTDAINAPELLIDKPIFYITKQHFPLLFLAELIQNNYQSTFYELGKVNFDRIEFNIKPLKRGTKDKYGNLRGYLRNFLDSIDFLDFSFEHSNKISTSTKIKFTLNIYDIKHLKKELNYTDDKEFSEYLFHVLDALHHLKMLTNVNLWVRKDNEELDINIFELSEGERQIITLESFKKVLLKRESLILFDEPDSYLHPQSQRVLLPTFYKNIPNHHQSIITTHSPFVAQSTEIENILLFDRKGKVQTSKNDVLSFDAIIRKLFYVNERFNLDIENDLNEFRTFRNKIIENQPVDKLKMNELIQRMLLYGEETQIIIQREMAQLKRIKKFEINGKDN